MVLGPLGRTALCTSGILALAACAPTSGRIIYSELPAGPGKVERSVADAEAGAIPVDVPFSRIVVVRLDGDLAGKLPEGSVRVSLDHEVTDSKGNAVPRPVVFYAMTSAVPIESRRVISMAPRRTFTDRTDLRVSYFEGTLVPKSIGTEMVDLVKTRIQQIGSAVTAAIPLTGILLTEDSRKTASAADKPPEPFDSFVIDVKADFGKQTGLLPLPTKRVDPNWAYRLEWLDDRVASGTGDPTAVTYDDVKKLFQPGRDHGFFPSTVCRDVMLSMEYRKKVVYSAIVRIADPQHVRLVPLPAKGSLSFHGVCGVDMVDGTRAEPDHLGALEALFKQAALIDGATSAARK